MGGGAQDREHEAGSPSPPVATARLAGALTELSARVEAPAVRAQLHALAALLSNLDAHAAADDVRRRPLERAIAEAIAAGDEAAALSAMRRLAALDRAGLAVVDWSAVSRG